MMVLPAVLGDGGRLASLLIGGSEAAILRNPAENGSQRTFLWSTSRSPVLAIVCHFLRIARARMRSRNISLRQVHSHHFVNIVSNDLVTVQKHDALKRNTSVGD